MGGTASSGDEWGSAVAIADFNGDHLGDVVVGAPGKSGDEGIVSVIRGSSGGALLTATGRYTWSQDAPGVPGSSEPDDEFGWSLAAGDFNGDTHPDLAIGVPDETVGDIDQAGTVDVIYGSGCPDCRARVVQAWNLTSPASPGSAEAYGSFGKALAAGNFNGDAYTDLADRGCHSRPYPASTTRVR